MGKCRGALAALAVLTTVFWLTGCASPQVVAATTSQAPLASPTQAPAQSAAAQRVPGGTAKENLSYFDLVDDALFAAQPQADGRAIIDGLVAAGFDKSAMQVTPDSTPTHNDTDSIQFAVQLGSDCLIGQFGGGEYSSVVGPALATGGCLVGKTRPIDW
ncbi:MAG: hypothetical protein ABI275_05165 [Terrimesophilobacter sp.]